MMSPDSKNTCNDVSISVLKAGKKCPGKKNNWACQALVPHQPIALGTCLNAEKKGGRL